MCALLPAASCEPEVGATPDVESLGAAEFGDFCGADIEAGARTALSAGDDAAAASTLLAKLMAVA